MSEPAVRSPAERAVRAHLESAEFRAGVAAGRWRLVSLDWPIAMIAVSAEPREGAPSEFVLRFELSNYPDPGPTAGAWDLEADAPLAADRRPKGEPAAHIFRSDWHEGRALYAPWDAVTLQSHQGWASEHPLFAWHARRTLSFYLQCVSDVLHGHGYLGV